MDLDKKSKVLALIGERTSNREVVRRIGRSEGTVWYVRWAAAALGTGQAPDRSDRVALPVCLKDLTLMPKLLYFWSRLLYAISINYC